MDKYVIDFAGAKDIDQIYKIIKKELNFHHWYGDNLNGLRDFLKYGLGRPVCITLRGFGQFFRDEKASIEKIMDIFSKAEEGDEAFSCRIEWEGYIQHKYTIDFAGVSDFREMYRRIYVDLGFGEGYGANTDALWDMLREFVNQPVHITICGVEQMKGNAKKMSDDVLRIFAYAKEKMDTFHFEVVS